MLILVFGVLGCWVFCLIFGILAWVWGNTDLKEMDAGRMDATGRDMTQVGRILGIVSVGLVVVVALLYFALRVFGPTLD